MKQGLNKHSESEYTNKYAASPFTKFQKNYQSNLDFRTYQKGRFQRHIREPFEWDEDDWYDIDSDYDTDEMYQSIRRSRPLSKYKHDKLNRMYANRLSRSMELSGPRRYNSYESEETLSGEGDSGQELHLHYEDSDTNTKQHRKSHNADKQNPSKKTHAKHAHSKLEAQQHKNAEARRRLHDSTNAAASHNSMSRNSHYAADGLRNETLVGSGTNRLAAGFDNGHTTDDQGNPMPWQRGGSHSPYVSDGTGTSQWASEYEREYRTPRTMEKSIRGSGLPYYKQDWYKRCTGASYSPVDPTGYGLSYGKHLRDEDIIPAV